MLHKFLRLFRIGSPKRVEDILAYPEGKRIYREHHNLRREIMDQDALKVVNRLNRHGYRSYLVGGCVRDMILGKRPKDFDVVTQATPAQIRKVFSNSRAIGRRFKIVHVVFRGGKVIEVSTFRSLPTHRFSGKERDQDILMQRDNQYGNPKEDAARRDFSINAIFFDPRNESIIDYVGGYEDIKEKRICVIGDPDISFQEDPVRMFRAAKFAALLNFKMDPTCLKAIRKNRDGILKSSSSRMLEEYAKIFRTGRTFDIFQSLYDAGLFETLFPEVYSTLPHDMDFKDTFLGKQLALADKMLADREELTTTLFFALLLSPLIIDLIEGRIDKNIAEYIRSRIDPAARRMNIPSKDMERLLHIFMSQGRFTQQTRGHKKTQPDLFRKKVFFFESFMFFKISSITLNHEENIQKAMFWEIGPRSRPPEFHKLVTLFVPRTRNDLRNKDSRNESKGDSRNNDSKNDHSENQEDERTRHKKRAYHRNSHGRNRDRRLKKDEAVVENSSFDENKKDVESNIQDHHEHQDD